MRLLQGPWQCKSTESTTVFDSVEFEDNEWTDYDEKVSRLFFSVEISCPPLLPLCRAALQSPSWSSSRNG